MADGSISLVAFLLNQQVCHHFPCLHENLSKTPFNSVCLEAIFPFFLVVSTETLVPRLVITIFRYIKLNTTNVKNMHLHRDSNPGPWNTVPML